MEYRAIREGEWDQGMALWTGVFGVPGWLFQSLHDSTTGRSPEHTRVAVDDGRVVSAVDVFMRDLRGIDGKPLRVGGIGSVATLPEYRKQGLSGQLLEDAIAVMTAEGCAWSFLFTGTHHHYARYGWFTLPLSGRRGVWHYESMVSGDYHVEPLGDEFPLEEMARIYESFNANRPLSHVRSPLCWAKATLIRLQQPERKTWGAYRGADLVAYVSVMGGKEHWTVDEACCLPGEEDAFPFLFEEVREAGPREVEFLLPHDPALSHVIEAMAGPTTPEERGHTMVRPMPGGLDEASLRALFAAPGRQHYELDNF